MKDWAKVVIVVAGFLTVGAVFVFSGDDQPETRNAFIAALITIVGLVIVGKQGPPNDNSPDQDVQDSDS